MQIFVVLDTALFVLSAILIRRMLLRRPAANLPPGPRGWPLVGNILDIPSFHHWKTFAEWGEKWGDIISYTILGHTTVVLNSPEHASALLDKRSATYSDRPPMFVVGEFVGWAQTLVLAPYGPHFREMRKLFAQLLGSRGAVSRFMPLMETETHVFLLRLLQQPENVIAQVRRCAGAIILKMAYGYEVRQGEEHLLDVVDTAAEQFALASAPGAFLVDLFPTLKRLPVWMPGTGWRKTAMAYAKNFDDMCNLPHKFVKAQMAAGTAIPSFIAMHFQDSPTPEHEFAIKMAASSIYSGGADTTVSSINSFFLAISCYPEVQKKAQLEIDTVIGPDRLPSLADRDRLPYVTALCLEVLRWNPVAPLGVPHRLTEDDVYEGYFFPKGTIFIANIWKFLHDPHTYAEPLEFNPDRFLPLNEKEPERDPRDVVFGFGRRICPGLHFAEASTFLSCAMSLAVFDISKAVENGAVVDPVIEYSTGTISHPRPFKCTIRPRSARAEALIRSVECVE